MPTKGRKGSLTTPYLSEWFRLESTIGAARNLFALVYLLLIGFLPKSCDEVPEILSPGEFGSAFY